ncbi:hypothetical protein MIMGU_mgv1a016285mg [Erythranthe guttata]|uniref:Basic blue protein n=1 Tax=Erythranthe guttata TaxID=4155 RepID=A0A022PQF4_ERYGU|nr:PREDICTED: basic blue protein-like [Erythranthe guttata]EYU18547.1 hypothetical protein MIMGU_mgv1a016285mg [Erythranthe guttata]|eukprot:XP_012828413.1 PREDICTED: basic blue protein-like [Erythranthe guttata]
MQRYFYIYIEHLLYSHVTTSIVMLLCNKACATSYTVGDSSGWDYDVSGWENGKSFKSGDTLVFNYPAGLHSVVAVDKSSYDLCSVPANAPTYTSGQDNIVLNKGANYFICGIDGHCEFGMKIAANAF